jgi:hypothetical protein
METTTALLLMNIGWRLSEVGDRRLKGVLDRQEAPDGPLVKNVTWGCVL